MDPTGDLVDAEQALARGNLTEALALTQKYIATAPTDARGHYLLGIIHDQQKSLDKAIAAYTESIRLDPQRPAAYQRRGVARFMLARPRQAVEDFDKYLELRPDQRPHHWQRGIALYYAGQFDEGAKQFDLHKTVNPDDVENAAWHFLCVAKTKGPDAARRALIDVKGDPRIPMMKVRQMLAGKAAPDGVIAEANKGDPDERDARVRLFYAHLYVGLYFEAIGEAATAKEHVALAAGKYLVEGYMGGVARVHMNLTGDKRDAVPPTPAGDR